MRQEVAPERLVVAAQVEVDLRRAHDPDVEALAVVAADALVGAGVEVGEQHALHGRVEVLEARQVDGATGRLLVEAGLELAVVLDAVQSLGGIALIESAAGDDDEGPLGAGA